MPFTFSPTTTTPVIGTKITIASTKGEAFTVFPVNGSVQLAPKLNLGSVFYGGIAYAPGQYSYDPVSGLLTIPGLSPLSGVVEPVTYYVVTTPTKTTNICGFIISQFLKDWNVQGEMSIDRSFGGHPSLRLSFWVECDRTSEVKTNLLPGLTKGIKNSFRIESLSISQPNQSNLVKVELNAVGMHAPYSNPSRSPLDKPYQLKGGTISGGSAGSGVNTVGGSSSVSLAALAASAGIIYSGASLYKKVPKTTSSTEYTTFRQELESRAVIGGGFVYYDDPNSVQLRTFGTQNQHTLTEAEVISVESESFAGAGAVVSGEQLAEELRNCVLQLQFDTEQKETDKQEGVTIRWEFENADDIGQCALAVQDAGYALVAFKSDILRTPAYNFDNGGYTKIARKYTEFNGLTLQTEEWTYGFSYTSLDVHTVTGAKNNIVTFTPGSDPQSFWGEVRHSISNYIYDSEGYLIRVETKGKEKTRFKKESDNEAIALYAQALQAGYGGVNPPVEATSLYNQAIAYTFSQDLPINENTDYSLSPLSQYYSDVTAPNPEDDPSWVQPRFYYKKLRLREDTIYTDNPSSSEVLQLPPLVSGKTSSETEKITITSTNKPERFNRRTSNKNQEGESGQDAIALSSVSQNIGRPSPHTRLDLTPSVPPGNNNYEQYKDYNFWLSTPNSGSNNKVIEQTLSYPDVDSPGVGLKAAVTEYSIKNSRSAHTMRLRILHRYGLANGDTVWYRGIKWIIFAIAENYNFKRNQVAGEISLTLGAYINCPVSLVKKKKPS